MMEYLLFKKMYYRLDALNTKGWLDYHIKVHTGYLQELVENLGKYETTQVLQEYYGLKKIISKLITDDSLTKSWSKTGDLDNFPCMVNGERINYSSQQEYDAYYEKIDDDRKKELNEVRRELKILDGILDEIKERIDRDEEQGKKLVGFGFNGDEDAIKDVFNFFDDAHVFEKEDLYKENFTKVFMNEPIFTPVKITEGNQQLIAYFFKVLLSKYKDKFTNTANRWERLSQMFIFDGEIKTSKQLSDVNENHISNKIKLIKSALSSFGDS